MSGIALTAVALLLVSAIAACGRALAQTGDFDCQDFGSRAEAQDQVDAATADAHRLDTDQDGVACEEQEFPPVSNATYEARLPAGGVCGGSGTLRVTVNESGTGVAAIGLEEVAISAYRSLDVSVSDNPVTIVNGSFSAYFSVDGHEISISATFDGDRVSGRFSGANLYCAPLSFTGQATGFVTVSAPTVETLPDTGEGGGGDSAAGGSPASWIALATAVGAVTLTAGFLLLRRPA